MYTIGIALWNVMECFVIHSFYRHQLVVEVHLSCNNTLISISFPALLPMCFFLQDYSLLLVLLFTLSHSLDSDISSPDQPPAFHQDILQLLSSIAHDGIFSSPASPAHQQDFIHQRSHSPSHSFSLTTQSTQSTRSWEHVLKLPSIGVREVNLYIFLLISH